MKKATFLFCFLISNLWILSAIEKPKVAIMNFTATGVSNDDATVVTEILRSKIITSNVFDVLERNNIDMILKENELSLSGIIDQDSSIKIGGLIGADYLLTGSFMKLGGGLVLTINLVNVKTGQIIGTSEQKIKNLDTVYDSLTISVTNLIKSTFGMKKFTFSTEPEGSSFEVGANYLTDFNNSNGYGFSLGYTGGRGKYWMGYSTMWNFSNIQGYMGTKLISNFGALNLIYGDKVNSAALLLGLGAGYDFTFGIVASPNIGIYYKNFYVKYSPTFDITLNVTNTLNMYHQIEFGYSLFLGNMGKEQTYFK
jgi:TolB-like protein